MYKDTLASTQEDRRFESKSVFYDLRQDSKYLDAETMQRRPGLDVKFVASFPCIHVAFTEIMTLYRCTRDSAWFLYCGAVVIACMPCPVSFAFMT